MIFFFGGGRPDVVVAFVFQALLCSFISSTTLLRMLAGRRGGIGGGTLETRAFGVSVRDWFELVLL